MTDYCSPQSPMDADNTWAAWTNDQSPREFVENYNEPSLTATEMARQYVDECLRDRVFGSETPELDDDERDDIASELAETIQEGMDEIADDLGVTLIAVLPDGPQHCEVLAVGEEDIREQWDDLEGCSQWKLIRKVGDVPEVGARINFGDLGVEVSTDVLW